MSALAPSRNSYSNNDSSAEQNVARVATNDKENQPHSINKNTNSSNNANRSFGPMKERTQLQKMGALMDQIIMDDNHNHNNHQQQQAEEKAASSNKRNEEVNENESNNNATSTALSRRRRLTGQLAASLLTPQDSNANGPPAWDGFVRKGTQLKSFLDDALHQVATGYAVTNVVGTKRQRLAEEVADALSSAANKEDGHQSWEERDQAASAVAKEKTSEAILLKQVSALFWW